jgi:UDP-N-acetyl-D-mannosaminuronic acid dehydrogenase
MSFRSLVKMGSSVKDAIALMSSSEENKFIAGIAVVVDDASKVVGVISDGDLRRGLAKGHGLDSTVKDFANTNPVTVHVGLTKAEQQKEIIRQARGRRDRYQKYDKIILVGDDGRFHDLVRLSDIFDDGLEDKVIAVYGMGFVGLTLASVLANNGLVVAGIDTDPAVVETLKQGKPHFFENGLESLLLSLQQTNPIRFSSSASNLEADIHLITVGTPIDEKKRPILDYVVEATKTIAQYLKKNNLVVFRSTLPVGTTRQVLVPILEKGSGLEAGQDFYLAFAPERTVEGNALEELRTLPQVIGGINRASYDRAAKLFGKITNTVIEVESLEAAEMIKLMNNTYRDVVFSFANEVSNICDQFNINAFNLIEAANEGYPRNRIPLPSPGVGGPCLTKDAHLYTNPSGAAGYKPVLGQASRSINENGHIYVMEKLKAFSTNTGKAIPDLKVYVIGFAFKGMPETSDLRDSMAVKFAQLMPNRKNVFVKDYVVEGQAIRALGFNPVDNIVDGFEDADAVIVMNNHYLNNRFNVLEALGAAHKPMFFFDGWNLFNQKELERIPGVCYATMGYIGKAVGTASDNKEAGYVRSR